MKKIGDLLTALGVVGMLAVVMEFVMEWRMLTDAIFVPFLLGSLLLLLIGIILRSIGKSKVKNETGEQK